MSIKDSLIDEFMSELEVLNTLEVGSEAYKIAVDGITKIADRLIEIDKVESERDEKRRIRKEENDLELQKIKQDWINQLTRNGIEGVKVVGGLGLAAWAFVASMNFEKEGTLTTEGGRSALKQLLKFIK